MWLKTCRPNFCRISLLTQKKKIKIGNFPNSSSTSNANFRLRFAGSGFNVVFVVHCGFFFLFIVVVVVKGNAAGGQRLSWIAWTVRNPVGSSDWFKTKKSKHKSAYELDGKNFAFA